MTGRHCCRTIGVILILGRRRVERSCGGVHNVTIGDDGRTCHSQWACQAERGYGEKRKPENSPLRTNDVPQSANVLLYVYYAYNGTGTNFPSATRCRSYYERHHVAEGLYVPVPLYVGNQSDSYVFFTVSILSFVASC